MQGLFKKAAAIWTLAIFLIPSTTASAATLEGQVVSVTPQAEGLWKVVVTGDGGDTFFILSDKTAIQKEVSIETLKSGDRLVRPGAGTQGIKGIKDPLSGMSDSTKKALGLPNIPNVPEVPKIPPMPDKNQMLKGNGAAASAQPGEGGGGSAGPAPSPGGAAPKKPSAETPEVKTQDEMLKEQGFQEEKLLFPPQAGVINPGEEVTQVNKTDLGFEVTVISETGKPVKETYAPGKKVLKVSSLTELKKNDNVLLNFNEKDRSVIELQVKA